MSAGLWALVRTAARARVAARADRLRLLTHLGASEDALAKPFCTGLILAAALGSGLGMAIGLAAAGTLIWSPSAAIALATLGFAAPELHGPDLVGGLGWSPIAVLSAVVASLTGVRTALRRTV
jgi:cell division protein FtsX